MATSDGSVNPKAEEMKVFSIYEDWWLQPRPWVGLLGFHQYHDALEGCLATNGFGSKSLPSLDVIPEKKEKKPSSSYSEYEPKGILKANWIRKRANGTPMLMVMLLQRADEVEQMQQNINKMCAKLRTKGYNLTRIFFLIVSESSDADDEFLRAIRYDTEVEKGQLGIYNPRKPDASIPKVLQWFSTTIRLVIKRLKKCKGKGRKNSAISCRLNYKLCYYNDLLGSENYEDAIKFAQASYQNLQGFLQKADDNGSLRAEAKVVGHILAFKIISLLLRRGKRLESVDYFASHLNFFQHYHSLPGIDFRHKFWFATQNAMFAQMLAQAKLKKVSRIQDRRHHPGHYYQTAAVWVQRWKSSSAAKMDLLEQSLGALGDLSNVLQAEEYTGQVHGANITNLRRNALIQERPVEHSKIALCLFRLALNAFGEIRMPRQKLYLRSQIAFEQVALGRYIEAQPELLNLIADYERQGWRILSCECLVQALVCSLNLEEDVENFFHCSLKLLNSETLANIEERKGIQNKMRLYLENTEIDEPLRFDVRQENLLETKVSYSKKQVQWFESFEVVLTISSQFVQPVTLDKLEVTYDNDAYNFTIELNQEFLPKEKVEIRKTLTAESERYLLLPMMMECVFHLGPLRLKAAVKGKKLEIIPTKSELEVELLCDKPPLLREHFPVKLNLSNGDHRAILGETAEFTVTCANSLSLIYDQETNSAVTSGRSKETTADGRVIHRFPISTDESEHVVWFFLDVSSSQAALLKQNIAFSIIYTHQTYGIQMMKEDSILLEFQHAIRVRQSCICTSRPAFVREGDKFDEFSILNCHRSFVMLEFTNQSKHAITLHDLEYEALSNDVEVLVSCRDVGVPGESIVPLKSTLNSNESLSVVLHISPSLSDPNDQQIDYAKVAMKWNRARFSCVDSPTVYQMPVPIQPIRVLNDLIITVDAPRKCVVGEPIEVQLTIENDDPKKLKNIFLLLEKTRTRGWLTSGAVHSTIALPPSERDDSTVFSLVALSPGRAMLPKMQFRYRNDEDKTVFEKEHEMGGIYVQPRSVDIEKESNTKPSAAVVVS